MIKQIFHISDIHIHLYKKNKQYLSVLENLTKEIKQRKTNESIIVITGDLFHTKTEMSPQSIQMADLYLTTLSNLLPTIIIAGNHDTNLSNKNRLDSIGPIVSLLNNDRIMYYRDTGWYYYDNLNFWVSSVFDQRLPQEYPQDGINICLYHGRIENVIVNEIQLPYRFKIQEFEKFDFVLLGDIHQTQQLCSKPLIAYAGSIIQLNFGEQIKQHGFLIWDLQKKEINHIQIENDYAYYNIFVDKGKITSIPQILAKHPRIKIKYSNTSYLQLKDIQDFLKQTYNAQQIMLSKIHEQFINKTSTFKYNLNNIKNISYQQKIIKQYINHINKKLTQDQISKIIELNELINCKIKKNNISSQQSIWSIEKLQFDNFFSYGENNVVQFYKHKGIVGIIGENRVGKSALIDIILFLLFDRTPRTTKSISLLNTKKETLWGKITLSIDGKSYIIQRKGTINKKNYSLSVKCKFYTFDENGEQINLSGAERSDTNFIIQQYIGTYEDALSTFFSTQGNSNTFIQSTNTNRKALLNSLLNLNIFDYCYLEANQQSKQLKGYLNNIDLQAINLCILNSETIIKESENKKQQLEKLILLQQASLEQKQSQLKLLLQSKKNFSQNYIDIQQIQILINESNNQNIQLKQKLNKIENKFNDINLSSKQLEQLISKFKYEQQIIKQKLLEQSKIKYDKAIETKRIKQVYLTECIKKAKLLEKVGYDENCKYCMSNPLTKDAISSKKEINILNKQISQIDNCIFSLKDKVVQFEKLSNEINIYEKQLMPQYQKCISLKAQYTKEISDIQSEIIQNNIELEKLIHLKQLYYENQQALQENHRISLQVESLQNDVATQKQKIKDLQSSILSNKILIISNNQIINKNIKDKEKYLEIASKYNILQLYKEIIGKNGLQYHITSNIVNQLQYQINLVLQIIANFIVEFVFEGKSIDINIVYPDKTYQVETCSGFEKFIISIAIRHALSSITNKSKGKIFVIDEGFGVLDSENTIFIDKILEFIASKYQTLLVISHLENMKTMFNEQIHIEYKEGYSRII